MRFIVMAVLVAAFGYGFYWWGAARALDAQLDRMLATPVGLSAGSHDLGGFPYRFDLTLQEPAFATDTLRWQAPDLRLQALSYRPHHLIATFPATQTLTLDGTMWDIRVDQLQASIVTQPQVSVADLLGGAGLRLDVARANLAGNAVDLTTEGTRLQADSLRAALRPATNGHHEIALEAFGIAPDGALRVLLDPDGTLPAQAAIIGLQGNALLDAPMTLPGALPGLDALTLSRITLEWGSFQIDGSAELTRDTAQTFDGRITLTIRDWPRILRALMETGAIPPDAAPMAQMMLAGMADPQSGALTLPLQVSRSVVSLGPFALLRLP